jgi:hypothetical protein
MKSELNFSNLLYVYRSSFSDIEELAIIVHVVKVVKVWVLTGFIQGLIYTMQLCGMPNLMRLLHSGVR